MAQHEDEIRQLKQLNKDTLINRAMSSLRESYPKICTPENGFKAENFGLITLNESHNDVSISFGHIFSFIPKDQTPLVYSLSFSLISKSSSIGIIPYDGSGSNTVIPFYKPSLAIDAIKTIVDAYRKRDNEESNRIKTENQILQEMQDGLSWSITDKGDYYDIETDSWHTAGWEKINKNTLTIYDQRHKHYDRSGDEDKRIILKQNKIKSSIIEIDR